MKQENQGIWIGEKDLTRDPDFIEIASQEFADDNLLEKLGSTNVADNLESTRRDFLKYLGFGLGAATLAASCEIPVKRAIPYVIKPDEIVPGVANYYATSYVRGGDYCAVLVKTREGRPIKIEGNSSSPITKGGTSARAQAMVLDLYDLNRQRYPSKGGEKMSWSEIDGEIKDKLSSASNVRILTNTVLSPSGKAAMSEFAEKYPGAAVVVYDPVSSSAQLDANQECFGQRVIPNYRFDKADVIVSFNADFLGTWISPVEYATQYAAKRKIKDVENPTMSRHIQVESHMSLTGSNADNRILVKPSEQGAAIVALHNAITGGNISGPALNERAKSAFVKVALELKAAKGKSLVLCGTNNVAEQILVNSINNALGNIGETVDFNHASLQRQGNDSDLQKLMSDMKSGSVDVLIVNQANPVYDTAYGAEFAEACEKVGTTVALSYDHNETSKVCEYNAPVNHGLESWGDAEPKRGIISTVQPTIAPLFDTRQAEASILVWADSANYDSNAEQPYMEYVQSNWEKNIFPKQNKFLSLTSFRDNLLHDGILSSDDESASVFFNTDVAAAAVGVTKAGSSDIEVVLFETVNIGNGQFASNPWLMEMPDPITRCSWGNYLAVPVGFDGVRTMVGLNDLKDGDVVEVTIGEAIYNVPVMQQFGQMPGTVGLALGYGRKDAGKCATDVGVNVNPSITMNGAYPNYYAPSAAVSNRLGKEEHFSCVQYHHTMGVTATDKKTGETINADEAALVFASYGVVDQGYQGALTDRSIIYNSNVKDLTKNLEHLHEKRHEAQHLNDQQIYAGYDDLYKAGHHWGMHVDLNACIGCGACTVACMAENNVPVVGKKEVTRHHEMTWLRIDRYYYGNLENPNTVYQPMMCQHCDNAPCENVCPVNATNHSSEGLNQMAYNRCVGTRYCANNCPYKVRRFNWLDYTTADIFPANQPSVNGEDVAYGADNLTRMVLNPDVTVRARGVIEKCSFCVQRIQEGKLTAKQESRRLVDSDVKTACQTSCPTGAITFGDFNNKKGELNKKLKSPLNYVVLEEVNVRSSVNYTMKVNNRDESLDA